MDFSNSLKGADAVADTSDTEHEIPLATIPMGRPHLNVLDELTVELTTTRGSPRKYRCGGTGCTKVWKPRTRARVLAHCKGCLKHTSAKRRLAASASAEQSPGTLVSASSTSSLAAEPSQSEPSQPKTLV